MTYNGTWTDFLESYPYKNNQFQYYHLASYNI